MAHSPNLHKHNVKQLNKQPIKTSDTKHCKLYVDWFGDKTGCRLQVTLALDTFGKLWNISCESSGKAHLQRLLNM